MQTSYHSRSNDLRSAVHARSSIAFAQAAPQASSCRVAINEPLFAEGDASGACAMRFSRLQHHFSRPGPRCYSRRAQVQATAQIRSAAEANAALMILSAITFVVAFALAYVGWGF